MSGGVETSAPRKNVKKRGWNDGTPKHAAMTRDTRPTVEPPVLLAESLLAPSACDSVAKKIVSVLNVKISGNNKREVLSCSRSEEDQESSRNHFENSKQPSVVKPKTEHKRGWQLVSSAHDTKPLQGIFSVTDLRVCNKILPDSSKMEVVATANKPSKIVFYQGVNEKEKPIAVLIDSLSSSSSSSSLSFRS